MNIQETTLVINGGVLTMLRAHVTDEIWDNYMIRSFIISTRGQTKEIVIFKTHGEAYKHIKCGLENLMNDNTCEIKK
jgi:hypothetical protein